jgi:hypothetical protein
MSTHFTYEIDERKLRVKLKDLETPYDNTAWERYEAYAGSQNRQYAGAGLKKMQLPLNRNVIVPIVFGGLIIFFSFLLFNFINIKNPAEEAAKVPEVVIPEVKPDLNPIETPGTSQNKPVESSNTEAIKEPETTITSAAPVSSAVPVPVSGNKPGPEQNNVTATKSAGTVQSQPAAKPAAPSPQPLSQPGQQVAAGATAGAQPTTPVVATGNQSQATPTANPAPNTKKRKRRNVDIADSDPAADSSRPVDTGDREGEAARPN